MMAWASIRWFFFVGCCGLMLFSCQLNSGDGGGGILRINGKDQPVEDTTRALGLDVSDHQEYIDWEKLGASNLSFVFIKATGGETFLDPSFHENWAAAIRNGLACSAYHFYYSKDDPIKQADFYIREVRKYLDQQSLPPVVDVEEKSINSAISPEDFAHDVLTFLAKVEYELNQKPMVYCDPSFAKKYLNHPAFKKYYLWLADYGVDTPTVPTAWQEVGYTFWQKSATATVPGITGKVDLDVFKGTTAELKGFFQKKVKKVYGVDVSHHQSEIDWERVKQSGISFAFIKATGGMTFVDPSFHRHWEAAVKAGIKCGPYHFYYSKDTPSKQANFFLRQIKNYVDENSLPPVVDVEEAGINSNVSPETFAKNVLQFLSLVESGLDRKPIIYCDPYFAGKYLRDPALANYYLWIADYEAGQPEIPKVWADKGYEFWQNSSTTNVPGIKGLVDHDVFVGSLEKLKDL